jgi:hypothetical protein
MKKPIITCLFAFISAIAFAQPTANKPIVDKIVGQVGDKIILMSEIESFYLNNCKRRSAGRLSLPGDAGIGYPKLMLIRLQKIVLK